MERWNKQCHPTSGWNCPKHTDLMDAPSRAERRCHQRKWVGAAAGANALSWRRAASEPAMMAGGWGRGKALQMLKIEFGGGEIWLLRALRLVQRKRNQGVVVGSFVLYIPVYIELMCSIAQQCAKAFASFIAVRLGAASPMYMCTKGWFLNHPIFPS